MPASVELPAGLEQGIEAELARGQYSSKSELIRDAVRRLLEERGLIKQKNLSADAREGIRQARREASVPFDDVVGDEGEGATDASTG